MKSAAVKNHETLMSHIILLFASGFLFLLRILVERRRKASNPFQSASPLDVFLSWMSNPNVVSLADVGIGYRYWNPIPTSRNRYLHVDVGIGYCRYWVPYRTLTVPDTATVTDTGI